MSAPNCPTLPEILLEESPFHQKTTRVHLLPPPYLSSLSGEQLG